jgi:phosphate starvation-inducible protein PhoH
MENNNEATNLSGNVGWTLWNMSKRISASMITAKNAREHLNGARESEAWTKKDLSELEDLVVALEGYATRGQDTWGRLREAQEKEDGELVTYTGGVSLINGGGTRSGLRARLGQIYGEWGGRGYDECLFAYREFMERGQVR